MAEGTRSGSMGILGVIVGAAIVFGIIAVLFGDRLGLTRGSSNTIHIEIPKPSSK